MKPLKLLALPIYFGFCFSAIAQWNPDPSENNLVCAVAELKQDLQMVSDGNNGSFLFWSDRRHYPDLGNIYGQHLDAEANILWEEEARPFCLAPRIQRQVNSISDGQGGAYIVWLDARISTTSVDVWQWYAQHVNANGIASWQENGIPISGSPVGSGAGAFLEHSTPLCADGSGGFIIAWAQSSAINNTQDCFAQRVDIGGNLLWNGGNPLPVRVGPSYPQSLQVLSDGAGGAYIVHTDTNNGSSYGIRAHRISADGELLWGEDGLTPLWGAAAQQFHAALAPNNALFVAWQQNPSPHFIKAQLVASDGQILWQEGGVEAVTPGVLLQKPRVEADEYGCYITFLRTDDVYVAVRAQKLNFQGQSLWGEIGVPLTLSQSGQQDHKITPDGFGGAVIHFQVNSVSMPGGNPSMWVARNVKSDGTFNGDIVIVNNSTSSTAKGYKNVLPLNSNEYLMTWLERRPPHILGSRQVYASKFFFTPYEITNVSGNSVREQVSIYPNPANGQFRIDNLGPDANVISVFDSKGQIIYNETQNRNFTDINTINWKTGLYLVKIEQGDTIQTRRVIVK